MNWKEERVYFLDNYVPVKDRGLGVFNVKRVFLAFGHSGYKFEVFSVQLHLAFKMHN